MSRKEVVEFIKEELHRLRYVEHLDELLEANDVEKILAIKMQTTKAVSDFLNEEYTKLHDEEIADGDCMALVLWASSMHMLNSELLFDKEEFAYRLGREGGVYGQNIAAQIIQGEEIGNLTAKELFSIRYAYDYRRYYDARMRIIYAKNS